MPNKRRNSDRLARVVGALLVILLTLVAVAWFALEASERTT
jgi:cbb3-type cytochrome oxidase subunit 3